MIDKIAFLFTEGLKSFLRNKLTNFLCIITILINFTILGTFFIAGFNTENYLPPIEGDDIGNDIVEYLNSGDSTNRQVDIYKTKLENALKKAPWHNFFGKLNLGAILCVKDSYEGQRAVGYLDKDKMQYLYIDTICKAI